MKNVFIRIFTLVGVLMLAVSACQPLARNGLSANGIEAEPAAAQDVVANVPAVESRPVYEPGELVDYIAQAGDTLSVLAKHFNTTVDEIRKANTFIPEEVTTMPPGMPMKIPIYYAPFWGSSFKILPDSYFIYGPTAQGFTSAEVIQSSPGWLNGYKEYASGDNRSSSEIIEIIAKNYSVSPRLLLALLEYQAGGLSQPVLDNKIGEYPLGNREPKYRGLYLQLSWAANLLNNVYYGWRTGNFENFEHLDGKIERPDPWQNAASVALQFYFSRIEPGDPYLIRIGPDGFFKTFTDLYGDPWVQDRPHLEGSLTQPELSLPFEAGKTWAFTGGPHNAWGDGLPYAALDFAPGLMTGGCTPTDEYALAVADGIVARSETATVILDLDGDGDERTGWVVFYFHLATEGRISVGTAVKTGDPIGRPSCEGGRATGTHVHIARRYNGEWIPAGGPIAFNLSGWVAAEGSAPYLGYLTRFSQTKTACTCSNLSSQITASKE